MKNVFTITVEENKLSLIHGEKNTCIIKAEYYSADYNNISFYYKPSKKKISVYFNINEYQVLKDHSVTDIDENDIVTHLLVGKNFFGEMTSILVTKSLINYDEYSSWY